MAERIPETVAELHIYLEERFKTIDAKFETVNTKIDESNKAAFKSGGMAGAILTGVILGFFKIVEWIK